MPLAQGLFTKKTEGNHLKMGYSFPIRHRLMVCYLASGYYKKETL